MNIPGRTDNPFVRLINHRVTDALSRREDYLTECFAWVVAGDEALQEAFFGPGGLFLGERPDLVPASMVGLSIATQVQASTTDRPDIEVRVGEMHLLIECKVDAGYDPDQIARYLDLVRGEARGAVAAVVRRAARASAPGSTDPSFLGVFDWEQVAAGIEQVEEQHPARAPYRGWLLGLLAEYGLRPTALPTGGGHDLAALFEDARLEVEADAALMARIPALYVPAGGPPRLAAYKAYSGKGPPPRPVFQYSVSLVPRYTRDLPGSFGSFTFDAYLVSLSEAGGYQPMVCLGVQLQPILERSRRTQAAPRLSWEELHVRVLESGGVAKIPPEGRKVLTAQSDKLREALRRRAASVLEQVVEALRAGPIPVDEARVQIGGSWLRVPLAPLEALAPVGASPEMIRETYTIWLRAVLHALCDAHFEAPLAHYLAEAVLLTGP